ncbi:hypothetical protein [Desulfotalea psychrophila]|uniref:Uncharacterized protein n=1 Tax=Desulfotalea psychrophila (strain LSv54 / DSM 12343) TaxID=177439 RepID=Q6ANP6_DESPS|nr:hypothetical protein [Desulfotalea psychrophila]CAG36028.1 unknown protein [Desulfotalea psychrophila LSv54]
MRLFEIIPLSIFVLYIRFIDINTGQDWNLPFLISGLMALVAIILFTARKILFNRLFLGINIYLFSGALAIISHQWWLNEIYGKLHASGMLAWIVIVGFISLLLSPRGFIGVDCPDKNFIRKTSLLLLFTSVCAFALSFAFRGNRVLSEIIPFIMVFVMQQMLRNQRTDRKEKGQ